MDFAVALTSHDIADLQNKINNFLRIVKSNSEPPNIKDIKYATAVLDGVIEYSVLIVGDHSK